MNRILAILLSITAVFQTVLPALLGAKNADAPVLTNAADYINYIQEYGAPAMDTATFKKALQPLTAMRAIMSGKLTPDAPTTAVDVEFDENVRQMTDYIAENTGLDIEDFLDVMPNFGTSLGAALTDAMQIDTASLRQKIYAVGDRARSEGYTSLATMIYVFAMFFTVAESAKIYGVPSETDPDELVVMMDVTYRDGKTETVDPDIIINTKTGHAYNKNGTGLSGSGFEMDIYDLTLYTIVNSWQRKFGFNLFYDIAAESNPIFVYNTRRFKFTYGDKDWMIQIWKGNYALVTNGGEIGVYTREKGDTAMLYKSAADEDMLKMQLEVLHGSESLVKKGPETTWWLTAFKLSRTIYLPETLTMKFSVTLKNKAMLKAFTAAIDKEAAHDVTYTVKGLTVNGTW